MKSNKIFRRLGVLLVVLTLVVGAIGYIVYQERPRLRSLATGLLKFERASQRGGGVSTMSASRGFDFSSLISGLVGPEPKRPPHVTEEAMSAFINRFVEASDTDVRICEMLGDLREVPPRGAEAVHAWFNERLENGMENPYLEAILMPMAATFSKQASSSLLTGTWAAAFDGMESPDEIAQTQARAEIYSAQDQLNDVSLRAYHLFALFNGVNWHPELVQDPGTNELCEQIEARLQSSLEGDFSGVSLRSETQELLDWMATNGVTAGEARFNPATGASVSLVATPTSLEFATPWMKSVLETGLVFGLPPAIDESVEARR